MDIVKRFFNGNTKKKITIVVSACKYGSLSAYAFIVKLNGDVITEKVVPVNAKFSMLIMAGLVSALKTMPKGENIVAVDIHIPISKKVVTKNHLSTLIKKVGRNKKVRIFPRSGKTVEANVLCIEKLRYLAEINGIYVAGGINNEKKTRA